MITGTYLLLAFFGGIFATCLGALGSVIICAFVVLAGVCAVMAGCDFNIVTTFAFGFGLSPHLGLGPAACALTYAWKKGLVEDGKGIAMPLMLLGKPSVLIVGGIFAALSYCINIGLGAVLPGKIDSISASIVIIGIISKLIWGDEGIFGKVPNDDKRFGVFSKNNWMPHMPFGNGVYYWLFAGSVGFSSCYGAMMAYAAGQSEITVLLWGMAAGIISHFVADILADVFLVYGGGYVDPPSLSMTICSLVYWIVFPVLGLYNGTIGIITPVVLLVLTGGFALFVQSKRNKAIKNNLEVA